MLSLKEVILPSSSQTLQRERVFWIDNARCFAMLSMILGHVITIIAKMHDNAVGFFIEELIVAYNMPLFVVISGFCNYPSLQAISSFGILKSKIWNLWLKTLLPVMSFGILLFLASRDIRHLNCFDSSFWFLSMLFYLISTIYISYYISNVIHYRSIVYAISILLFVGLMVIDFQWLNEFVTYFFWGAILRKLNIFDKVGSKRVAFMLLMLALVCYIMMYTSGFYKMSGNNFYNYPFTQCLTNGLIHMWIIRQLLGFLFCLAILFVFKTCMYKDGGILSKWGRYTLAFYMFSSALIFVYLYKPINGFISNLSLYSMLMSDVFLKSIYAFIAFVFITLASWVMIGLCDRNKYSRIFLLGRIRL